MNIDLFVSYSHQDEWLKDELLEHLSALRRNGVIRDWHDRKIVPGQKVNDQILAKIQASRVFLFLVSPSFINSDYCMDIEYLTAKDMHERGEAVVVPVIIRDCDWDVQGLREFMAVPEDGVAVTRDAYSKNDAQQRDAKWLDVVRGVKKVVEDVKKKLTPPSLAEPYRREMFKVDFVRHPSLTQFDETKFFVEPEVYFERTKTQLNSVKIIANACLENTAMVFTGEDRSGKTLLAKKLQVTFTERGKPATLISGGRISNADIDKVVRRVSTEQFGVSDYPDRFRTIIIDDFDECRLPDAVKEKIIRSVCERYERVVIFSFSSAPTVLFTPDDLPNPASFTIEPFGDEKVYQLVKKWGTVSNGDIIVVPDNILLQSHEKVMLLFSQTEAQKYAYNVVTFLELLDAAMGSDIAPSSFASCYETLIHSRLIKAKYDVRQLDEYKNFLSLVAYRAFSENETSYVSMEGFRDCLDIFSEQYLSSTKDLEKMAVALFLYESGSGYQFSEDYLWYFLCARYVGKFLASTDKEKYHGFIGNCAGNIFQKKYANIIIYLAYFTEDNAVLKELMSLLDRLFSKADDWMLSDRSRSIILGLANSDDLKISASAEVDEARVELMRDKVADILENAEEVAAKYALPFLDPNIDDSELVEAIPDNDVSADSYMKSVNALLRTHSVIGQILNSRSGTYGAALVMECITKMVQASGRYASLNHAIATILIFDKEEAIKSADSILRVEGLSNEEKQKKVMRIFAFWSVFLSQSGLARYLSQTHSVRALERLSEEYESETLDDGHYPYNFTSVLLIAKLYSSGVVDKDGIEAAIEKYGQGSSLFAIFRAILHIYSYYMPLTIKDKQWVSQRLGIPLQSLEMQKLRASQAKHLDRGKLLEIDPGEGEGDS